MNERNTVNELDHRLMSPPSLRIAKRVSRETIESQVWDLRIAQPNVSHLEMISIHSLEHFLGTLLPEIRANYVNIAPMGCQTGFYIVTLELESFETVSADIVLALDAIGSATEVPLANNKECGWAKNHSLVGAQEVASWLLSRRPQWSELTATQNIPNVRTRN